MKSALIVKVLHLVTKQGVFWKIKSRKHLPPGREHFPSDPAVRDAHHPPMLWWRPEVLLSVL